MKGFFTTKRVVIGLVATALVAASATGVAIFLKDDGEASAAQEQDMVERIDNSNLPVTGNDETDNGDVNSEQNNDIEIPTTPAEGETETERTTTQTGINPITREEIEERVEETTIFEDRKVQEDLNLS